MDPRRVLTFRAVARERSFTRAAEGLSLSQPSVSQQVAALEREVGTTLLDRRPGGLELTAAGAVLFAHAEALADRLALARSQLAEIAAGERTRLRLGAFPSALAGVVPAAVARLRETEPDLEVLVDEASSDALPARVRSGALHVALAFQDAARPRREPEGVVRIDLVREPFLVALPVGHRLAGRRALRLDDLSDDDWTMPSTEGMLIRACRAAGYEPRVTAVAREQSAIRALVMRGLAVTLTPRLLADAFDGVALVELRDSPLRDVYALLPDAGRHPLTNAALDALRAELSR
jgi:DNA-binding transcriptional LysR family regulator